jgi:hypothetical protein
MSGIFRLKLPPASYRSLVLEARRFPGPAALAAGIVDVLGGLEDVLALVKDRGLTAKGRTGVYGLLKAEMYRENLALLVPENFAAEEARAEAVADGEDRRRERGAERLQKMVADASRSKGKAKL